MPFQKYLKGLNYSIIAADGLMYHDYDAISHCQLDCMKQLATSIQLEQEMYMSRHPEIFAMMKLGIRNAITHSNRRESDILSGLARYFERTPEDLDKELRQHLDLPPDTTYNVPESIKLLENFDHLIESPYVQPGTDLPKFCDQFLNTSLYETVKRYTQISLSQLELTTTPNSLATESSSFVSVKSSPTTLPTPLPTPVPDPTISQIFYERLEQVVDKATLIKVTEDQLKYDTAYVELMKAVEVAMEIPIIDIRKDIADLWSKAIEQFDEIIEEKQRIKMEIAWDRRMRKKYKRTVRRQENFRGYETPPSAVKSVPSSHESYKLLSPLPCVCHPRWTYNRYPKDRFGIYLPNPERDDQYASTTLFPSDCFDKIDKIEEDEKDNTD